MQKSGVQITWRIHGRCLKNLANVAPVVATMSDDVQKHLLPRHLTRVSIREGKPKNLSELVWGYG